MTGTFKPMKRSFYFILLAGLLITGAYTAYSQNADNSLGAGMGITLTHLRDKSVSPLTYSGTGLSGGLSFERVNEQETLLFQFRHDRATIRSTPGNSSDYIGFAFKNYSLYHRSGAREKRVLWGWSNNNVLASYEHASYGNFGSRSYYFTSFGPAAAYRYPFELFGQNLEVRLLGDIQLAGFFLRPSYVSGSPDGFLDPSNSNLEAFVRSIDLFIPGKAWNLGVYPALIYRLPSGNALSLEYCFEYTRINEPEPVSESAGNWLFRLIMIL